MKFEVGKFYEHTSGICIVIISECKHGSGENVLLVELGGDPNHTIYGISTDEKNTDGFCEITKEEWVSKFSTTGGNL